MAKEITDSEAVVLDLAGRGFSGVDRDLSWSNLLGEWAAAINEYTAHLNEEDFKEFLKGYGLVSDELMSNKEFFKPFLKILKF